MTTNNRAISCRMQQLGSAVIDLQRKLNHEIKEREIDENALSNRYEKLPVIFLPNSSFSLTHVYFFHFGLD